MQSVQFNFRNTFAFEPSHQVLKSLHHMGAYITADEDIHDVISNLKRALIGLSLHKVAGCDAFSFTQYAYCLAVFQIFMLFFSLKI